MVFPSNHSAWKLVVLPKRGKEWFLAQYDHCAVEQVSFSLSSALVGVYFALIKRTELRRWNISHKKTQQSVAELQFHEGILLIIYKSFLDSVVKLARPEK